jgi:hypothetical protein
MRRVRRNRAVRASSYGFMTVVDGAAAAHPFYRIRSNGSDSKRSLFSTRPSADIEAAGSGINAVPSAAMNITGHIDNMAQGDAIAVTSSKPTRLSATSEKSSSPTLASQTSLWAQ